MYTCPNCGQNLKFDISRQQLFCEYCNTQMDPYAVTKERDAVETKEFETTVFTCPQCGGELVSEDQEATAFCSYCGGATILDSRIQKKKRPDYIIPFQKTKEDCYESYRKLTAKAFFTPKEYRDPERINSFRGIYMPYWSYTLEHHGVLGIPAKKKYRQGDYVITEKHEVYVDSDVHYEPVSFDASGSFSDELSNAIAPFDQTKQMKFTPSFLSGFYADTSDFDESVYEEQAKDLVSRDLLKQVSVMPEFHGLVMDSKAAECTRPKQSEGHLVMLPVWFMSHRFKDHGEEKVTYFVVNGQTGQVAGDLPISKKKYFLASLLLSAILFVLLNFVLNLTITPLWILLAADVASVVMAMVFRKTERRVFNRETGCTDLGFVYTRILKRRKNKEFALEDDDSSADETETRDIEKVSREDVKEETSQKLKKKPTFFWVPLVLTAVFLFVQPIQDFYYYGAAIIAMAFVLWMILRIIWMHNRMTTWKLPQFSRTGGDDRAKH